MFWNYLLPHHAIWWILLEPKTPEKAITNHKRTSYQGLSTMGRNSSHSAAFNVKTESHWAHTSSPKTPKLKTASWFRKPTRPCQIYNQRSPLCGSLSTVSEDQLCFLHYSQGSLSALGTAFCCCLSRDKKCVFRFPYLILNFTLGI